MAISIPSDNTPHIQCKICREVFPATPEYFGHQTQARYGLQNVCRKCSQVGDVIPVENIPYKACNRCGKEYPATPTYFQRNHTMRDGLMNTCKTCISVAKPQEIIPKGYKRCTKCHELKPMTEEFFYAHKRDIWSQACKECTNSQWRQEHPRKTPKREVPEGYKWCNRCQTIKPLSDFHPQGKKFRHWCKPCISEDRKNRRPTEHRVTKVCTGCHIEKPATPEYFHRRKANRDGLEYKCKGCVNAQNTLRNRSKRDRINQRQREHRATNQKAYLEQAKVSHHKRQARKRGNGGNTFTVQDIQEQLKRQKYRCYYCHCKFEKGHTKRGHEYIYHIEHLVPLARGGTNDPSNIVLSCPTCNLHKHDKLPHEWPEGGRLL